MKRRPLTLAAGASLLLCVTTMGLQARSYWNLDRVTRGGDAPPLVILQSLRGQLEFFIQDPPEEFFTPDVYEPPRLGWFYESDDASRVLALLDSAQVLADSGHDSCGSFLRFSYHPGPFARGVSIPHFAVALLFAIPPALRLRAAIRTRGRHGAGHCPRCGYDLRATPDRCPECGAVPAAQASGAAAR